MTLLFTGISHFQVGVDELFEEGLGGDCNRVPHLAKLLPTVAVPAAIGREPDVALPEDRTIAHQRDRGSTPVREVVGGVLADFAQSDQLRSAPRVQLCHLALQAFVVDSLSNVEYFLSIGPPRHRIFYCECTCAEVKKFADGQGIPHFYPLDKTREAMKKFRFFKDISHRHFADNNHYRPDCKCPLFWAVHIGGKHVMSFKEDKGVQLLSDTISASPGSQSIL